MVMYSCSPSASLTVRISRNRPTPWSRCTTMSPGLNCMTKAALAAAPEAARRAPRADVDSARRAPRASGDPRRFTPPKSSWSVKTWRPAVPVEKPAERSPPVTAMDPGGRDVRPASSSATSTGSRPSSRTSSSTRCCWRLTASTAAPDAVSRRAVALNTFIRPTKLSTPAQSSTTSPSLSRTSSMQRTPSRVASNDWGVNRPVRAPGGSSPRSSSWLRRSSISSQWRCALLVRASRPPTTSTTAPSAWSSRVVGGSPVRYG